jgi:diacylglycerol kinase family enzyme
MQTLRAQNAPELTPATKLRSAIAFVDFCVSTHIIAHQRLQRCRVLAYVSSTLGVEPQFTRYAKHAEQLANDLPQDASLLVVAGGDGTLNEVLNAIMLRPKKLRPTLFLVPGGSGNDAARTLGVQRTLQDVERRLKTMATIEWDVIKADIRCPNHQPITRYGINVLSTGISAEVLRLYYQMSPLLPAGFRYTAASVLAFARYRATYLDVQLDGKSFTQPVLLAAVANCRWFGAGLGVAPKAVPHDGVLNLTVADSFSRWGFLRLLPQLRRAEEVLDSRIRYHVTTSCQLRSAEPMAIEIDGEFSGFTPGEINVLPKAVTLVG